MSVDSVTFITINITYNYYSIRWGALASILQIQMKHRLRCLLKDLRRRSFVHVWHTVALTRRVPGKVFAGVSVL